MKEVQSLNSFFDGYVLASHALGVGRAQAYALVTDGFTDRAEVQAALERFDRRKFRFGDDMVLTTDFVKSRPDIEDWLRGVARALLDSPSTLTDLREAAAEDEGADILWQTCMALLVEGENLEARLNEAQRAGAAAHVASKANLLLEMERWPLRRRVSILDGFLRVLERVSGEG